MFSLRIYSSLIQRIFAGAYALKFLASEMALDRFPLRAWILGWLGLLFAIRVKHIVETVVLHVYDGLYIYMM